MNNFAGAARVTIIGVAGFLCLAQNALAAGFALREGSADWEGNAFAGNTAKAYDASTVYTNPAGMVRLNWNELDAAVNVIAPNVHFSGANFVGPGLTTPGTDGGNLLESAVTVAGFGVWNYSPALKFGLAVTEPFGQRVSNPGDFVGRYQSLVSSISDVSVSLAAAYRFDEHFSVGGGPVIDYFAARLTRAINTGPTAVLTGDPVGDVHGDNVSGGFNIGALYEFSDNLRVGLDYRSRIQHNISGTQSIFVPPLLTLFSPSTAALLNSMNSNARTKVTLPDDVSAGVYWQVSPQWAVMADVEWTDWSLIQAIHITPTNPFVPGTTIQENWRNTWFASIGANYQVTNKLLLQTGFAYDESPVTDSNRTTRIPDANRYLLSVGGQYAILPNVTVQAAYLHVFVTGAPIDSAASATSGVIRGKYSNNANVWSVGAKVRF
jgi:long-chain fatty acid transport protein